MDENMILREIIIHFSEPDEEPGFWVECPSLGIASEGTTLEETFAMIQEAIEIHIEDLMAHGEEIPSEV